MARAELPHPSELIKEELEARGWDRDRLATEMVRCHWGIARVALDFYLEIGAANPNMRLGEIAEQIDRAFGVSEGFFARLEASWLESLESERG